MKRTQWVAVLVSVLLFSVVLVKSLQAANKITEYSNPAYAVLHTFAGGTEDGAGPLGSLTHVGRLLYGMTMYGGAFNQGTLFAFDPVKKDLKVLHSFSDGPADGANPTGSLTLVGNTLYGMTTSGGANYNGTIFKYNIQAGDDAYKLLYSLGSKANGPEGSLTVFGAGLYGMTVGSGLSNGWGTIFRYDIISGRLQVLHNFEGPDDGESPYGDLTLLGTTFYGMTPQGGPGGYGVIFECREWGNGFKVLHSFSYDGIFPSGSLTPVGAVLYGMTESGGLNGDGTIFKYNTNAKEEGFTLLHNFDSADGAWPQGSLCRVGTTLYGMTPCGGSSGAGTVFSYNTKVEGDGFALLHSFDELNGSAPSGSLSVVGRTLYGMTSFGGANNLGVIFSYVPDSVIAGTVKSASGKPIPKVTVALKGASMSASTRTDSTGAYSFSGLPDGSYTLTPTLPRWEFSAQQATVDLNEQTITRDFTANPVSR